MTEIIPLGLQLLFLAKISKKTIKNLQKGLWAISALVFVVQILFPHALFAQSAEIPKEETQNKTTVLVAARRGMAIPTATIPTIQHKVISSGQVITTAYSSTPDQTDSSPFITANGTRVYDGLIAANFLPYHTKVRFPNYFGDKIFTVNDRMNSRHSHRIDVWMPTRQEALQFGVQYLQYEIVEEI